MEKKESAFALMFCTVDYKELCEGIRNPGTSSGYLEFKEDVPTAYPESAKSKPRTSAKASLTSGSASLCQAFLRLPTSSRQQRSEGKDRNGASVSLLGSASPPPKSDIESQPLTKAKTVLKHGFKPGDHDLDPRVDSSPRYEEPLHSHARVQVCLRIIHVWSPRRVETNGNPQCLNLASIPDLPTQRQSTSWLKSGTDTLYESKTFTLKSPFSAGSNRHSHSVGAGSPPPPARRFPAPIHLPPALTAHRQTCPADIKLERLQL
ncbi:uncharacterized protein [Odocoileus virginianus]|uniref:Uncharacterized protein n=1 Tax=Odocoileus virginianus TaxID=9874 RepID=A0A6J0YSC3_ODOVR